jgi:GntR family transcriptional regulator
MPSKARPIPNHLRVEQFLRDRIRSGVLKPGDAIPPECQLAQKFHLSRMTVRQALGRLAYEGVIVRQRRRGSFVAEPRLQHTSIFPSFEEEMRARGAQPSIRLLQRRREPATGKVAECLSVPEGSPLIILERLRLVDGRAVGYEIRYLPETIGSALTEDEIRSQPLVPALRRILGRLHTDLTLNVMAAAVGWREAKYLGIATGAPVLVREHIWYVDGIGPVQCGRTMFRGDRYQMSLRFSSSPNGGSLALADQGKRSVKIALAVVQKSKEGQRTSTLKGKHRSGPERAEIGGTGGSTRKEGGR